MMIVKLLLLWVAAAWLVVLLLNLAKAWVRR